MKRQLCLFGLVFVALAVACNAAPIATPTASSIATVAPSETASLAPTATETPSETPFPISQLCSPLRDHAFVDLHKYVTQPFIAPKGENKETGHHGVDFGYYHRDGVGGPLQGNPIQSVMNGHQAGSGYNSVYGNYLIIETPYDQIPPELAALYPIGPGESFYALYAHMQDKSPFEIHEPIDCGQQIGQVGNSGAAEFVVEPHLHFETRVGPAGEFIEPMAYYDTQATEAEKKEYERWRSSGIFKLFDPMIFINYGASIEEIHG